MMNSRIIASTALVLVVAAHTASGQELLLFGGSEHDVYLGCLNCNQYSSESICNDFGAGNSFKTESIFNAFSGFGSEFSSKSPWNGFSSSDDVPVLVDKQGGFYGYFTINQFRSDAVDFSANLAEMHEIADGDLEIVQELLCNALGG
jgi:hypothetical protein